MDGDLDSATPLPSVTTVKSGKSNTGLMVVAAISLIIIIALLAILLSRNNDNKPTTETPSTNTTTNNSTNSPTIETPSNPAATLPKPSAPNYKLIESMDYKKVIPNPDKESDTWEKPVYMDLTGDGYEEGVYAYKLVGTAGYLEVFVYSNTNGSPTQIFKLQDLGHGSLEVTSGRLIKVTYYTETDPSGPTKVVDVYQWNDTSGTFEKV